MSRRTASRARGAAWTANLAIDSLAWLRRGWILKPGCRPGPDRREHARDLPGVSPADMLVPAKRGPPGQRDRREDYAVNLLPQLLFWP